MSTLVRFLSVLSVSCALLWRSQNAAAQFEPPPPLFPPAVQVDTRAPAYLARVELAERSLVGPTLEMASGIAFLGVGGLVNLASLMSWVASGNERSGGATFGATLAVVGAGAVMTWHGAKRIDRIRTARRALAFDGMGASATAQGGHAHVRFVF